MARTEQVKFLLEQYGKDDQRTDAWHAKRGEMLTASEIYKGLTTATPAMRHELIMSKLVPRVRVPTNQQAAPLIWGTRFEPIAKEIYCIQQGGNISIADTTCVPHPTVPFLGASPDGIIISEDSRHGCLVEFKCPFNRVYNPEKPIPDTYYHQMQLQMECTGIDECDYVEMRFSKVSYSEWIDSKAEYKSIMMISADGEVLYRPLSDKREVSVWKNEVIKGEDMLNWQCIYWILSSSVSSRVNRDPSWLTSNLESLTSVWQDVQSHRAAGSLPEHPKEKTILTL